MSELPIKQMIADATRARQGYADAGHDCAFHVLALTSEVERLEKEAKRLREGVCYWSYCMDVGMRETCPEKVDELCDFLMSLNIAPYSMRAKP